MINIIKGHITELDDSARRELFAWIEEKYKPISISDFAQLVQRMYKKNISFDISTNIEQSEPIITAIVITPFGEFSAIGKNKAIAKERCVQKAFKKFNNEQPK